MKKYDYLEAVTADVKEYIENEINISDFTDREKLAEYLNDVLFVSDSVTGNASGSYTFNNAIAREYVIDNDDLLREALQEFCVDSDTIAEKFLNSDYEYFDVIIRCYLLGQAIELALDDLLI